MLCSLIHTHLQRTQSIVVDHVGVTPQLQQLTYNRRVSTFGRVHKRRESLLVSFIDSALWKSVGPSHAVDDDAHVTCEGSEMQVGVPGEAS